MIDVAAKAVLEPQDDRRNERLQALLRSRKRRHGQEHADGLRAELAVEIDAVEQRFGSAGFPGWTGHRVRERLRLGPMGCPDLPASATDHEAGAGHAAAGNLQGVAHGTAVAKIDLAEDGLLDILEA